LTIGILTGPLLGGGGGSGGATVAPLPRTVTMRSVLTHQGRPWLGNPPNKRKSLRVFFIGLGKQLI